MSRTHYKIYETEYPYFLTSSFVHGYPLISDRDVAEILLNSLEFLQTRRQVTLYAYVLMENHLHVIVQGEGLSEKIRHFKSFTAKEIIRLFDQKNRTLLLRRLANAKLKHKAEGKYQVWQEGFHPKQVVGDAMMIQKIEYVHNNPVKRGYVDQPEYWRYSSARDYIGQNGLIPVTLYRR